MASNMEKVIKDLGIENVIKENVASGRSSGVTNNQIGEWAASLSKGSKGNSDTASNNQTALQKEPQAVETITVSEIDNTSLVFGFTGFILGALFMLLFCKLKIKRIQKDCETRVNEVRAALDRMLKITAKE